ncbi:MAG: hypothetical protein ABII79_02365 [bacterium]
MLTVVLLLAVGCGARYDKAATGESSSTLDPQKVTAESWLFDARLKRKGKPTSFRLEVFRTDSVIALGGRAYLGKGALKGRLTADSLEVYFPSSKEYVYESIVDLFSRAKCPAVSGGLDFLKLLVVLPDSSEIPADLSVIADYARPKNPSFHISAPDCPWQLHLVYDRQSTGWRLSEFHFDDGGDVTLKGNRRRYKTAAQVPTDKFRLTLPEGAVRVEP